MSPYLFTLVLAGGLASLESPVRDCPSVDKRVADRTFEEIRLSIRQSHQLIQSLLIEYKASASIMGKPIYPEGRYVLRTIAAKGTNRYIMTAHVDDHHEPKDDPRFSIAYYKQNWWNVYFPNERLYEISTKFADLRFPFTNKARGEPMLESLAWWPAEDDSVPPALVADRPFFLLQVLDKLAFRVLPQQELIRDRWCHVLEAPGKETFWVDTDTMSVVRRISYGGAPSFPFMSYEFRDFREVSPSAFLPYKVRRVQHDSKDGTVFREFDFEILRYELNNVLDSLFDFEPPPGTLIYDRDTDRAYQIPGGLDLMETICKRARSVIGVKTSSDSSKPLVYFIMGLGLYFGGWALFQSKRAFSKTKSVFLCLVKLN